jgi:heat shock protein HtpX
VRNCRVILTQATGLQTHIWNTNARCAALLALYPVIVLAAAWVICAAVTPGLGAPGWLAAVNGLFFHWAPFVAAGVLAWFAVAWFGHTRMIRAMARAHPVTRRQEPELYNALENLCISRGIPMPRLEVIESPARNAFASGIGPATYTVTVTRGLLTDLAPDEVEAVLAHELSHILHGDVRLLIVAVIFTGAFSLAAQMAWRALYHGAGRGMGRDRGKGALFLLAVAAAMSVGYVFAILVRYALSRHREYMADAGAAQLTGRPEAMMRALRRIASHPEIPGASADIALMATHSARPFLGLFATHPPIDARIAALSALTGTPVPDLRPAREPAALRTRRGRDAGPVQRRNPWLPQHGGAQ